MAAGDYVECKACGGIYRPILADGSEYYHACPASRVVDNGADPKDVTGQTRLTKRVSIDNRRDENIGDVDQHGKATIKSEGLGVNKVVDPSKIPPPIVL